MENDEGFLHLTNVEFYFNKKVLLSVLIVTGLSIFLSGILMFIFSDSIITVVCSLIIGITIGVLINYFTLSYFKIFKTIAIETVQKESLDDLTSTMKLE